MSFTIKVSAVQTIGKDADDIQGKIKNKPKVIPHILLTLELINLLILRTYDFLNFVE